MDYEGLSFFSGPLGEISKGLYGGQPSMCVIRGRRDPSGSGPPREKLGAPRVALARHGRRRFRRGHCARARGPRVALLILRPLECHRHLYDLPNGQDVASQICDRLG